LQRIGQDRHPLEGLLIVDGLSELADRAVVTAQPDGINGGLSKGAAKDLSNEAGLSGVLRISALPAVLCRVVASVAGDGKVLIRSASGGMSGPPRIFERGPFGHVGWSPTEDFALRQAEGKRGLPGLGQDASTDQTIRERLCDLDRSAEALIHHEGPDESARSA